MTDPVDPRPIREAIDDAIDDVRAIKDHPARVSAAAQLHSALTDMVDTASRALADIAVPGPPGPEVDNPS